MLGKNGLIPTAAEERPSVPKKNDVTLWKRSFTIPLSGSGISTSAQYLCLGSMTPKLPNQVCQKYHLSLSSKNQMSFNHLIGSLILMNSQKLWEIQRMLP